MRPSDKLLYPSYTSLPLPPLPSRGRPSRQARSQWSNYPIQSGASATGRESCRRWSLRKLVSVLWRGAGPCQPCFPLSPCTPPPHPSPRESLHPCCGPRRLSHFNRGFWGVVEGGRWIVGCWLAGVQGNRFVGRRQGETIKEWWGEI